eukprot:CAMPEP_0202689910 /NCGR_PEP_ID=MMETSP1385-20130828/5075_1 /ASSEMBLY_ACC=CAM_ASM_000861 /TAXON_ID=933848 /ORGANISM="Elphidium margaritaceum" /LENGTH=536 /DNA_ID=CAMNT_0049345125 /DNA_START=80 /DNA_END=1687 /DNA_ORIENTATION=+
MSNRVNNMQMHVNVDRLTTVVLDSVLDNIDDLLVGAVPVATRDKADNPKDYSYKVRPPHDVHNMDLAIFANATSDDNNDNDVLYELPPIPPATVTMSKTYKQSGMTPNTSYNSLASLDTVGTATSHHTWNTMQSSSASTSYHARTPRQTYANPNALHGSPPLQYLQSTALLLPFQDGGEERKQYDPDIGSPRPKQSNSNSNSNSNNATVASPATAGRIYQYGSSAMPKRMGGVAADNDELNTNAFRGCSVRIAPFQPGNDSRLQLKDYVFISKDCTRKLGEYVVKENWGGQYGLLYKYIDYIFRCQTFKRQTIEINGKCLVFHSGLQRRSDHQFLYVMLVLNKKYVAQKWRVSFGNIKNSFLSQDELLARFTEPYVIDAYLPRRTRFCSSLTDVLYDESFVIEVNWEERLTTNKDRICKVLGNLAFLDPCLQFLKLTELIAAFDGALQQTQRIAELNPRLAVAQGFVDTKHAKYRMELLLPLVIEFPAQSGQHYVFVMAVSKSSEIASKKYIAKSILTMDMAYANARLVGYVDSTW